MRLDGRWATEIHLCLPSTAVTNMVYHAWLSYMGSGERTRILNACAASIACSPTQTGSLIPILVRVDWEITPYTPCCTYIRMCRFQNDGRSAEEVVALRGVPDAFLKTGWCRCLEHPCRCLFKVLGNRINQRCESGLELQGQSWAELQP